MSGHFGRGSGTLLVAALVGLAGIGQGTAAIPAASPAGTIMTIAGGGSGPGPATDIAISPCGMVSANGHLYFSDSSVVRAVNASTDWLTTPVGSDTGVTTRIGGPATSFNLPDPCGMAADGTGNLIIETPRRILAVAAKNGIFYGRPMTKGDIYYVGAVQRGRCGCFARGIAVDHHGDLLVPDLSGNYILVIAARSGFFYGRAMRAGHDYTVAGNGTAGHTGDGGPARKASLDGPLGVAVDGHGNLIIADTLNNRIRVVAVKTGRFYGLKMRRGDIYTIVDRAGTKYNGGFSGDGGPAVRAKTDRPSSVAVDKAGNVLLGDSRNMRVRVVALRSGNSYGKAMRAGHIYTLAGDGSLIYSGDGGPANRAGITPSAITVDGFGNIAIIGFTSIRLVASSNGTFYGEQMKRGDIYTIAGFARSSVLDQDGWLATRVQLLSEQPGMAVDSHGNVIVADWNENALYVIAAQAGTFYGRPMSKGHIYVVAGGGRTTPGNGGPSIDAEIGTQGVTVDRSGNLVVTDVFNDQLRVIADSSGVFYGQPMTAGHIYVVAGGGSGGAGSGDGGPATQAVLREPAQVTLDSAGNLVFADAQDGRIRVVAVSSGIYYGQQMTAGDIYTIAGTGQLASSPDGTLATQANLDFPDGVAVDDQGNVVIFETGNDLVRVVPTQTGTFYGRAMTSGHLYTIAGGGTHGLGDGGPATQAQLGSERDVIVDSHGNIVIPDSFRIRVIAVSNGTFYGVPMVAGDIYTVTGTGIRGFSGDGGQGLKAELEDPQSVAVDSAGDLFIGDGIRIREVTG
ncbi:MAG TPA: hypothetical protein VNF47_05160 [Streptosporangiaceae bacterium]|nr:hypothetical protein [Streptosporangiaceae bacterium]